MKTHMRREIEEIPQAVERLLQTCAAPASRVAAALRDSDPLLAITIARGSSDHAAHFLKYAIELTLCLPVASLGPSLASIYGVTPRASRSAAFAISQSGKSPDIVAMAQAAAKGGALTLALCNTVPSPLTAATHHAIDIGAGPERSIAATKSFVCSIVAGLTVIAHWAGEDRLLAALQALPQQLHAALSLDWSALERAFDDAESIFILGRGPTLPIASEAALKLKETCGVHAEAYSAAEVLHGPVELVGHRFPVLALACGDKAERSTADVADSLAGKGASVHATSSLCRIALGLPLNSTGHPLTDALMPIVPFYGFAERWSRQRGRNPDTPRQLKKVTETH